MSQLGLFIQVIFDLRCADCGAFSRRFFCSSCLKTLSMSQEFGSAAYLFEDSSAAHVLSLSRKKKARDLLAAFIHVRIDQLGWDVGRVVAKRRGLEYVARRVQNGLEGRHLLALDLDPRLCLTLIEL